MFTATDDADYLRHLTVAGSDLHRVRPKHTIFTVHLEVDQERYMAPNDLYSPRFTTWGNKVKSRNNAWSTSSWLRNWTPPKLRLILDAGSPMVELDPPPSSREITCFGSAMQINYNALWLLTEVQPVNRHILLLRAQAEAMQELANRGIAKPVQLRDGQSQGAANGSPAAMHGALMKQFLEYAA